MRRFRSALSVADGLHSVAREEKTSDWVGVAYGVLLGVLAAYQQFKLPPALPLLFELYGYDKLLAGGFMSVYAVTGLLFSFYIGRSMAQRGPSPLLFWAFGLLLVGNFLALATPGSGPLMLLSRLLEGVAFAVLAVMGGVIATTSANEKHRPIAIALWATWIPLGQISSSLIAIPLVGSGIWRPLWWVAIGATLLMAYWGWRLKGIRSESRRETAERSAERKDGAVVPEEKSSQPKIGSERKWALLLSAVLFSLWTMQYLAFSSWLPQYLVEVRGLTPDDAAVVYLFPPVLITIFCIVSGWMIRAWGMAVLLPASIAVQAAVWFSTPMLGTGVSGILALAAYGVTVGITPTCLFALPSAILGGGIGSSHGFAAIMTGRNLGAFVGPLLLAQAVKTTGGWNETTMIFGVICVAAMLLGTHVTRRIARLD